MPWLLPGDRASKHDKIYKDRHLLPAKVVSACSSDSGCGPLPFRRATPSGADGTVGTSSYPSPELHSTTAHPWSPAESGARASSPPNLRVAHDADCSENNGTA